LSGKTVGLRGWLLLAIAAVALGLRLIGLQYGLPAVYNMDESAIMRHALSFARGTLEPRNYLYPSFYFYVLFAWVGTYLGFVWLTGGVSSLTALKQMFFTHPTAIYTAGRALTAICGVLGVLAVFKLGQRLFDARIGLAAAIFLAVAPLAVRDSHYVKHDIPATLLVVLSYVAISRIWPCVPPAGRSRNDVVVAGAACGVAFSTHYYCIFLALPLAWAVVQRWRSDGWTVVTRHLFAAGIVSAVVFFALSPFILVEPLEAWRDITANRQIVLDRAFDQGPFSPWARYLEILWTDSMGRAVVAAGMAGVGWMLVVAPARAVLLLLFPVAFFAFISNTVPASRYLNPLLPFVALFAAWAVARVSEISRVPTFAYWVVVGLLALSPAIDSVRSGLFFRTDDTRTLAERFMRERVPSGSTVLIQPYSVSLMQSREGLLEALREKAGGETAASTVHQIQLSLSPYPQPAYRLLWLGRGGLDEDKIYIDPAELLGADPTAPLRRHGVTYVILKRYNQLDPELMPLIAALAQHGRLIAEFSPYRAGLSDAERARIDPFLHNTDTRIDEALERPGPPLEIWQLDGPDS
jgi:4-amino-4-deoxy-L-arabinose transferase-like glycosyltransferase